ncbi:MAG: hypothetical protein M3Q33_01775 [Acidobacteriota bacterium]|nr:hypothetical protein [Acidobacteriota bacterium]
MFAEGINYTDWKESADGGKVAAHKIQRSENGEATWTDAGTSIPSEYTLYRINHCSIK